MIKIINFSKSYKDKLAVDNISLEVNSGDIFGFIGPNGSGKSTTIKSIVGILDMFSGDILINDVSVKQDPIACKKIMAYIADNPDLYDTLTGIKYLNFICDIYEVSKEKREANINKYAKMFEIDDVLNNQIKSYSHGMKQKLAIISALAHEPKILILDEPFVGLDPKASRILKDIMIEETKNGMTIFFSSHVLEVVEKLCNKIAIIKDGKIVKSASTKDLTQDLGLEQLFMELV